MRPTPLSDGSIMNDARLLSLMELIALREHNGSVPRTLVTAAERNFLLTYNWVIAPNGTDLKLSNKARERFRETLRAERPALAEKMRQRSSKLQESAK